jgi:Arc/MetJ-type ribon-helix-helix transcriptional regulator
MEYKVYLVFVISLLQNFKYESCDNVVTCDVRMMLQTEEKWATVRVPVELLKAIEKLVKEEKDEFGMPRYSSKSEVVAEAVKQFLKKHKESEA